MRRKKPAATPPNVAGIASRLEAAPGELVDASELAGAGGSEPRGAERMCLEPGLTALAEYGRTPSGACTDAGTGILRWCIAAFELGKARKASKLRAPRLPRRRGRRQCGKRREA